MPPWPVDPVSLSPEPVSQPRSWYNDHWSSQIKEQYNNMFLCLICRCGWFCPEIRVPFEAVMCRRMLADVQFMTEKNDGLAWITMCTAHNMMWYVLLLQCWEPFHVIVSRYAAEEWNQEYLLMCTEGNFPPALFSCSLLWVLCENEQCSASLGVTQRLELPAWHPNIAPYEACLKIGKIKNKITVLVFQFYFTILLWQTHFLLHYICLSALITFQMTYFSICWLNVCCKLRDEVFLMCRENSLTFLAKINSLKSLLDQLEMSDDEAEHVHELMRQTFIEICAGRSMHIL